MNRKHQFRFLIILTILLFSINSCQEINVAQESEWLVKILKNPTCDPPCWEKIIPGHTLANEVTPLLNDIQGIELISIPPREKVEIESTEFEWSFNDSNRGIITTEQQNGYVVAYIGFFIDVGALTINDFIMSFNEPSHIFILQAPEGFNYSISLVYKSKGINLNLGLRKSYTGNIKVSKQDIVDSFSFFDPENAEFNRNLLEWKGFDAVYSR